MINFTNLLEQIDLSGFFIALSLFGAILSVYVMQLTHYEAEDLVDPWIVRSARRFTLMLIGLAQLWSAGYAIDHQWQPWPPEMMLIAAINMALVVRVVAIWARIKRSGHRCWDDRAAIEKSLRDEAIAIDHGRHHR